MSGWVVLAVRYGRLKASRRELYANFDRYGEADEPIVMDYYFWLITDGSRTLLVDTGFDATVGRARGREVLCEPLAALRQLGFAPESVSDIILTHFHYDHIGNIERFPGARLFAAEQELEFWRSARNVPAVSGPIEGREVEHLEHARADGRLRLMGPADDLGIPGITLLPVPGHTPGQLAVEVSTAGGTTVLASDAAHFYEEFESDRPFHIYTDVRGMLDGFAVLRDRAAAAGTVVIPGHDPLVMSRFPPVDGATGGLAVRVG